MTDESDISQTIQEFNGFSIQSDDFVVDVGFIYVIYDTMKDIPIYVGATINPHTRFNQHRSKALHIHEDSSELYKFMNKNPFHFKVIKTFNQISNYFLRNEEAKLIQVYTNIHNYKLFNINRRYGTRSAIIYDSKIKDARRKEQIKFYNDKNSKRRVKCETCSHMEKKEVTHTVTGTTCHKRSRQHRENVIMEEGLPITKEEESIEENPQESR